MKKLILILILLASFLSSAVAQSNNPRDPHNRDTLRSNNPNIREYYLFAHWPPGSPPSEKTLKLTLGFLLDSLDYGGGGGAVTSVNGLGGVVVLDPDDLDDGSTNHKFVSAAQISLINSGLQPGDNVSELINDSGFLEVENDGSTTNELQQFDTLELVGSILRISLVNDGEDTYEVDLSIGSGFQPILSEGAFVDGDKTKLDGIEFNATQDQSDIEIETAYNNQVSVASQVEAQTPASTTVYRWTPERVYESASKMLDDHISAGTQNLITVTYDPVGSPHLDFVVDDDLANYDNSSSGFLAGVLPIANIDTARGTGLPTYHYVDSLNNAGGGGGGGLSNPATADLDMGTYNITNATSINAFDLSPGLAGSPLLLSGGTNNASDGFTIELSGNSANAYDAFFKSAGTTVLEYDNNLAKWIIKSAITDFDDNIVEGINTLTADTYSGLATDATGDETIFNFSGTVNKATSGDYTGLKFNVTETSAPGSDDKLLDLQVGGSSRFLVANDGDMVTLGDLYMTFGIISGVGALHSGSTSQNVFVSGGTQNDGGNIWLKGSTSTDGGDIRFRQGTDVKLEWDASAGQWEFATNSRTTKLAGDSSIYDLIIEHAPAGGGSGDMTKSVYDMDNDGDVDDSELLEGQNSAYHLNFANHSGTISSGTWNGTAIGDSYLTKTGNWTGTFDGQEGSDYLARANHTGTQNWSTITSTPTTLSGYGITDAQSLDSELTAIAGLTSLADRLPYYTGPGAASLATFTNTARSLLDDPSTSAMRTTLGLGNVENTALSTWTGSSSIVTIGVLANNLVLGADMHLSNNNHDLKIAGGSNRDSGGNVRLYGESHFSQANDVQLRSGIDVRLEWDDSESNWDFNSTDLKGVSTINGHDPTSFTKDIALSRPDTVIVQDSVYFYPIPYDCTLDSLWLDVMEAPTGDIIAVAVLEDGTDILSTNIQIDASETSSRTAATSYVISDASLAEGNRLWFSVKNNGSTTTGKGLIIKLYLR